MSAAALKLASFSANACAAPSRRSRPQHLPLAPRDPVWPVPVSRRTRAGGDLYQRLARLQCVAASSCFGLATPTPQPIGSRLAPPIAFPWLPWRACASGTAWGTRPCALNGIEADVIEHPIPDKWKGLSDTEILRRQRISRANRGKTAWNTGRKHSEATKEKIRQRTREAMQRPEVIEKLKSMKHPKHDEAIKEKIRASLKQFHERRGRKHPKLTDEQKKERRKAAAAKRAETMRLRSQAEQGGVGGIFKKVQESRTSIMRSEEHRLKISMSIKRKWADPQYRDKQALGTNRSGMSARSLQKDEEEMRRQQAAQLAEKRVKMRSHARTLVNSATSTVKNLEQKMASLHAQPALQIRVQQALEQARGLLHKAKAKLAQVEMEIAMNSYPALDSWEMVDGIDASDAAASEGQFSWGSGAATPARQPDSNPSPEDSSGSRPPSAHDGGNINGASTEAAAAKPLGANGHHLKVNGHSNGVHLDTNGHTNGAIKPLNGEPVVDGRLVKAAFNMRKAVAASFDKESDAGDLNTTDKDAKEGDTRRASRRRQQSSAGTLFGEHGSQQANRVWKNGRLVPETEAADEQSEA